MRPSIALPTGPYDWHPEDIATSVFEARLAQFRALMRQEGIDEAVVHGNGFDHASLHWLAHFTPKLGPAYLLVPMHGPLRLLFSGGPGMKPSAQRMTWIEDVAALKRLGPDLGAWLSGRQASDNISTRRIGIVEGTSMLRSDWNEVAGFAGSLVLLDDAVDRLRLADPLVSAGQARARTLLDIAVAEVSRRAKLRADIRSIILDVERAAYAAGAQDIRILVGLTPGGRPKTPPGLETALAGPTWFSIHVRHSGEWAEKRVLQTPA